MTQHPTRAPSFHRATSANRVQDFIRYCKKSVVMVNRGELSRTVAAYDICGAVRYDELAAVAELDEIIDMACALEIKTGPSVGPTWKALASAIGKLPDPGTEVVSPGSAP
jgi:hypothetical protein